MMTSTWLVKGNACLITEVGMAPSNGSSSVLGGCLTVSMWDNIKMKMAQVLISWSATALCRKLQLGLFAVAKHLSCPCCSQCVGESGRQTQLQTGKSCSC